MIDVLAIGVHPDDIELGCSGTIIKHIQKGDSVVLMDLTQGELGSRGTIYTRYEEAENARKILGVPERVNLKFRDGFFTNDEKHQLELIKYIRKYKPKIVLANAYHDRHPDHGRASELVETACFLSGLRQIKTTLDGIEQECYRPSRIFHYIQDRYITPDIIVDISDVMDQKIESILAYKTQFNSISEGDGPVTYISRGGFLDQVKARAKEFGHSIGGSYGEGFTSKSFVGVSDLSQLYYPEFS